MFFFGDCRLVMEITQVAPRVKITIQRMELVATVNCEFNSESQRVTINTNNGV
jgi:hypothetical protein